MKKIVVVMLCLATISVCSWLFLERVNLLDIPSNKNDFYANIEKQKIDERIDIHSCEKSILKREIDLIRRKEKELSQIAWQTQVCTQIVIGLQVILLLFIFLNNSDRNLRKEKK
ncbi:hypothetical protein [Fulvivirga sediminis]|uniref:Uncharacterized protein n=1 Tax=Fulvivirga sediminis TaxID=2803949 RepID=A0A937K069_9BACT|nr:hypothetical protein [Fulvivirga sediminis]MBL3657354.1 hypothetical protein [Fulvivirga sediminis]